MNMVLHRFALFLIGMVVLGSLVGCGAAGSEPDYTIEMERPYRFTPASLTIPFGSTVAWHNGSDYGHTITTDPTLAVVPEQVILPSSVTPWESGDIYSGERWLYTFTQPGTYTYFCRHHQAEGMLGTITVLPEE